VDVARSLIIAVFESLFNLVLVIVISVYMLLDAPRLSRFLRRLFPGESADDDLITRVERALLAYVRGQILVSLAVGASAGVGLELLGVTGVFPAGSTYALAFGAWAAAVEIIPYLGPWLGALAPLAVAATQSVSAVVAVALLFLFIHQIEGHVIVPKLMGGAVKVHPLVVIFALLAAGELYGLPGVLIAMPLVAVGRETAAFLIERIGLEPWRDRSIPVEVEVEPEPQRERDHDRVGSAEPAARRPGTRPRDPEHEREAGEREREREPAADDARYPVRAAGAMEIAHSGSQRLERSPPEARDERRRGECDDDEEEVVPGEAAEQQEHRDRVRDGLDGVAQEEPAQSVPGVPPEPVTEQRFLEHHDPLLASRLAPQPPFQRRLVHAARPSPATAHAALRPRAFRAATSEISPQS
jgi:hypothetical protein